MSGFHYWHKGGWKCKSSSLAGATAVTPATSPTTAPPVSPPTAPIVALKTTAPKTAQTPQPSKNTLEGWLKTHKITNYTINPDGSLDVDGSVHLDSFYGNRIPIKFNKVSGDFDCSGGKLTTLENCPMTVGGDFRVHNNDLDSLVGFPIHIGGCCDISYNIDLTSLAGINGLTVGENFDAQHLEKLTTLKGIYKQIRSIKGDVDFQQCNIKSGILGIMMIDGVEHVKTGNYEADKIINEHLEGDRDPLAAQEELIDAGFVDLARP
jgi:hypothetical protein